MDIRFSMLMAHIANIFRDSKKRPSPFTWEDFKVEFGQKGPNEVASAEPSVEDLIERVALWTKLLGGVDKRAKPD